MKRVRESDCDDILSADEASDEATAEVTATTARDPFKRKQCFGLRKSATAAGAFVVRAAEVDGKLKHKRNEYFASLSLSEFAAAQTELQSKVPPRRFEKREDGTFSVLMTCMGCAVEKEVLKQTFHVHNGEAQLFSTRAGHEQFNNSASHPCNECFKAIAMKRFSTPYGWISTLMVKYSHASFRSAPFEYAYESGGTGKGTRKCKGKSKVVANGAPWFVAQWLKQGGTGAWKPPASSHGKAQPTWEPTTPAFCAIYGVPLVLGDKLCAPSVNNFNMTRGSDRKEHRADECKLVCAFANVSQHKAIPDLTLACAAAVLGTLAVLEEHEEREKRSSLAESSSESEAKHHDMLCKSQAFRDRIKNMANAHKHNDKEKGRDNEFGGVDELLDNIREKGVRCDITGMLFTADNGPFFPSLDRLDDSHGHTKDNVRWIARLFCGDVNPTRTEWLRDIVLKQTLVPLSLHQRELVVKEVKALT